MLQKSRKAAPVKVGTGETPNVNSRIKKMSEASAAMLASLDKAIEDADMAAFREKTEREEREAMRSIVRDRCWC